MTTRTPRTALAPTPLHLLTNIALAGVLCLSLAAPLANAADAAAQFKLTPSASSSLPAGMSAAETEAFAQFNRASAGQDAAIEPALAAWRGAAATATAVPAADLRDLPVPPLLLQPLVENSIRHGLVPKVEGGRIEVCAERRGEQLLLTVRDTGVGLDHADTSPQPKGDPAAPAHSHYGTPRHVAERLATLYGGRALYRLLPADGAEGGTLAEVSLHWPASNSLNDARPAA